MWPTIWKRMKATTNSTSHTQQTQRRMFWIQYLLKWQEKTFTKQRIRDEENKTYTFSWWFWEEMKQQWSWKWVTRCVWEVSDRKDNEQSQKVRGKNWKRFKNCPHCAKHAFFATEVSCQQDARSSRQNTQRQNFEKFSKCFSRLEGLPARESRAEPRKSLSNPRDWTFHSRTSRQKWPAKTRLRLATWLTRD